MSRCPEGDRYVCILQEQRQSRPPEATAFLWTDGRVFLAWGPCLHSCLRLAHKFTQRPTSGYKKPHAVTELGKHTLLSEGLELACLCSDPSWPLTPITGQALTAGRGAGGQLAGGFGLGSFHLDAGTDRLMCPGCNDRHPLWLTHSLPCPPLSPQSGQGPQQS